MFKFRTLIHETLFKIEVLITVIITSGAQMTRQRDEQVNLELPLLSLSFYFHEGHCCMTCSCKLIIQVPILPRAYGTVWIQKSPLRVSIYLTKHINEPLPTFQSLSESRETQEPFAIAIP